MNCAPASPPAASSSLNSRSLLVSCEHADNRVPAAFQSLFDGQDELLTSHRGYDLGALPLARILARRLNAPLRYPSTTRLLADLNRSAGNPRVFSAVTRNLPASHRAGIIRRYHAPYQQRIIRWVAEQVSRGRPVLHVAVHSFTPHWQGKERPIDLGLLYDPQRRGERELCQRWKDLLRNSASELRVRRNAPYRGANDGLPTLLRRHWGGEWYWGVELEVRNTLALAPTRVVKGLVGTLAATLYSALESLRSEISSL